jgi:hypothetical protein
MRTSKPVIFFFTTSLIDIAVTDDEQIIIIGLHGGEQNGTMEFNNHSKAIPASVRTAAHAFLQGSFPQYIGLPIELWCCYGPAVARKNALGLRAQNIIVTSTYMGIIRVDREGDEVYWEPV